MKWNSILYNNRMPISAFVCNATEISYAHLLLFLKDTSCYVNCSQLWVRYMDNVCYLFLLLAETLFLCTSTMLDNIMKTSAVHRVSRMRKTFLNDMNFLKMYSCLSAIFNNLMLSHKQVWKWFCLVKETTLTLLQLTQFSNCALDITLCNSVEKWSF